MRLLQKDGSGALGSCRRVTLGPEATAEEWFQRELGCSRRIVPESWATEGWFQSGGLLKKDGFRELGC